MRCAILRKAELILILLLASAGPAEAQSTAGARTIRPGDAAIDGARIRPGVWETRYVRVTAGQEQEVGIVTHELTVLRQDGEPLLRSVQTFRGARGGGVDTATAVLSSLGPRTHRSNHGGATLALDFEGLRVRGRAVSAAGEHKAGDRTLDAPVFDSNFLELVLGSLPLAEGLHVTIPTYVHQKPEPAWFEARVAGQQPIALDDVTSTAWAVHLTYEQGRGTFWIDIDSRQMVKGVMTSPDGTEIRMLRVPRTSQLLP